MSKSALDIQFVGIVIETITDMYLIVVLLNLPPEWLNDTFVTDQLFCQVGEIININNFAKKKTSKYTTTET